jgi:hypothetical protein
MLHSTSRPLPRPLATLGLLIALAACDGTETTRPKRLTPQTNQSVSQLALNERAANVRARAVAGTLRRAGQNHMVQFEAQHP